jgi:hypothetical protein
MKINTLLLENDFDNVTGYPAEKDAITESYWQCQAYYE